MALTSEQKHVLRTILDVAKQVGATPKERKAAVETALVEANLGNPAGGDGTSVGWRQETASSYPGKDRRDVRAAAKRFFAETRKVRNQYGSAGALSQAVQRSAYPGRYNERSGEAQQLLRKYGRGGGRGGGGSDFAGQTVSNTAQIPGQRKAGTVSVPGIDNSAARQQLLLSYLDTRHSPDALLTLGTGLKQAQDVPAQTQAYSYGTPGRTVKTTTKTSGGSVGGRAPAGTRGVNTHKPLYELFWQGHGGINVKMGKKVPQGFVSGHQDHVHVASTKGNIVRIGKLAQKMGLRVGENPHFGGVGGGHVSGSYHYKNEAIDVSGDPRKMAQFAHEVAKLYGIRR